MTGRGTTFLVNHKGQIKRHRMIVDNSMIGIKEERNDKT